MGLVPEVMSPSQAGAMSTHRLRCGEKGGLKKKINAPPENRERCVTMETVLTSKKALCDYSWSLLRSRLIKQGPLLTQWEMARAQVPVAQRQNVVQYVHKNTSLNKSKLWCEQFYEPDSIK